MRLPFNGSFRTNQGFGVNPAAYARFGLAGHDGIDYGLPTGTPVIAAHSGKVFVGSDPNGYGNYIFINDGKVETVYGHLLKATVASGSQVTEGQQIGLSDNTGNSTGAHLHFGVRPLPKQNNGYAGYVDPLKYLKGDEMFEGKTAEQQAQEANKWHAEAVRLLAHVNSLETENKNLKSGVKPLDPGVYQVK